MQIFGPVPQQNDRAVVGRQLAHVPHLVGPRVVSLDAQYSFLQENRLYTHLAIRRPRASLRRVRGPSWTIEVKVVTSNTLAKGERLVAELLLEFRVGDRAYSRRKKGSTCDNHGKKQS